MDTDTDTSTEAPAPSAELPAPAAEPVAPSAEAHSAEPIVTVIATDPPTPPSPFVSLYDSAPTAILAVVLGVVIVTGVQYIAALSFKEKTEHRALTRFVTAMVAIMVGVYVSDMLIAGPTAELLAESERLSILSFVKDTALMIFAYYFGTKSAGKDIE